MSRFSKRGDEGDPREVFGMEEFEVSVLMSKLGIENRFPSKMNLEYHLREWCE